MLHPQDNKKLKKKAKIKYNADAETDVFDYYKDEEPFEKQFRAT